MSKKKPAPTAIAVPPPPLKATTLGPVIHDAELVPLAQIDFDPANTRLPALYSEDAIRALATTLDQSGQLQSIRLREKGGGRYLITFGERRVRAARLLGWSTIRAEVVEPENDDEVRRDRAIENLQRADLNPIEEALAVTAIYETLGGRLEFVEAVAGQVGRSATWVRDRIYLSRLSGKARDLVISGALPLQHAREIAKLADARLRDELAEEAAAEIDLDSVELDRPMAIYRLRELVKHRMNSLAVVPWSMMDRVPGVEAPACAACPSNSANDPKLFEHAPPPKEGERCLKNDKGKMRTADEGPFCLSPACYERKRKAAEKIISSTAGPALKTLAKDDAPVSMKTIMAHDLVPAGVAEAAFVSAVRAKRPAKAPEAKPGQKAKPTGAKKELTWEQRDKVRNAVNKAREDAVKAWGEKPQARLDAMMNVPGGRAAMLLMGGTTEVSNLMGVENRKVKLSPEFIKLAGIVASPTLGGLDQLVDANDKYPDLLTPDAPDRWFFEETFSTVARVELARLWKIDMGPFPELDKIEAEVKQRVTDKILGTAPAPAAKPAAGKKAKGKSEPIQDMGDFDE